jgi:hypothetical protein
MMEKNIQTMKEERKREYWRSYLESSKDASFQTYEEICVLFALIFKEIVNFQRK